MHVMLGGKFECAVIRAIDKQNQVDRNDRASGYYAGLNRRTPQSFLDRAATFLVIADEVVIAGADWSDKPREEIDQGVNGSDLGIRHEFGEVGEWDDSSKKLAQEVLDRGLLTDDLFAYISDIHIAEIAGTSDYDPRSEYQQGREGIAEHYLCRLFLQLRMTQGTNIALVLDDADVEVVRQIGAHLENGNLKSDIEIPDTEGRVILGHRYWGPLIAFSPPDARAMLAIRNDAEIQHYAASIKQVIEQAGEDPETEMLRSMKQAYDGTKVRNKANQFFEIGGWIAKPINYIPVIGTVSSMISDAADVAQAALEKETAKRSWHLIAAKATQVGIEDFLERQHNRIG